MYTGRTLVQLTPRFSSRSSVNSLPCRRRAGGGGEEKLLRNGVKAGPQQEVVGLQEPPNLLCNERWAALPSAGGSGSRRRHGSGGGRETLAACAGVSGGAIGQLALWRDLKSPSSSSRCGIWSLFLYTPAEEQKMYCRGAGRYRRQLLEG